MAHLTQSYADLLDARFEESWIAGKDDHCFTDADKRFVESFMKEALARIPRSHFALGSKVRRRRFWRKERGSFRE